MAAVLTLSFFPACFLIKEGNFHTIIVHLWIMTTPATVWMKLHELWPLHHYSEDKLNICLVIFLLLAFEDTSFHCGTP